MSRLATSTASATQPVPERASSPSSSTLWPRTQGCPCRAGQFVDAHHTRCRGLAEANPQVHFHFTPVGAPRINQIEAWFSTLTRQSIRRGTFTSVQVLVTQIRDYSTRWNSNPKPFVWTATADEILAKVRLVQANVRKLVDNN